MLLSLKRSYLLLSGITDDDLRETAYEVLLACAGASGYACPICFTLKIIFFSLIDVSELLIVQMKSSSHLYNLLPISLFLFSSFFYAQGPYCTIKRKKEG